MDKSFLASSHVGTPDPRQEDLIEGQRLLIAWRYPQNLMQDDLRLVLTVRFWDQSEEKFFSPLEKVRGHTAYNFFQQKILTYRVQVLDKGGEVVDTWEHHFWTQWIDLQ